VITSRDRGAPFVVISDTKNPATLFRAIVVTPQRDSPRAHRRGM